MERKIWTGLLVGTVLLLVPGVMGNEEDEKILGKIQTPCGGVSRSGENGASEYVAKYQCPLNGESEDSTECCDPPEYKCCRERRFYEIDRMAAIIIAVTVVLCCLLITIAVVTCCLWEKCPLYMACRKNAKPDYIAHPDEVTALSSNMPTENVKNVKVYIPKEAATRPVNYV